jgi:hypothetical protein
VFRPNQPENPVYQKNEYQTVTSRSIVLRSSEQHGIPRHQDPSSSQEPGSVIPFISQRYQPAEGIVTPEDSDVELDQKSQYSANELVFGAPDMATIDVLDSTGVEPLELDVSADFHVRGHRANPTYQ